jgi:hypothetical protein
MTRIILISISINLFSQTAWAEEEYTCYLDKFMEVANDGRLFGPEKTKIQVNIGVKGCHRGG